MQGLVNCFLLLASRSLSLKDQSLSPQVAAKVEEILAKVARVEAQRAEVGSPPALDHIPPYNPLYGVVLQEVLVTCSPPPSTHKPTYTVLPRWRGRWHLM